MFTGIVTDVGTILSAETKGDLRVRIGCGLDLADVALGASIACSGVCLTVVDKQVEEAGEGGWFAVDVSGETRARTAPEMWAQGRRLNLERPLRVGDELGGHIVTGHVDGVAEVEGRLETGGSVQLSLLAGDEIAPFVATKGSIALDGVSLTVNEVENLSDGVRFTVNVIPHTAERTTLGGLEPGARLNVEIDILARYLERMMELRR